MDGCPPSSLVRQLSHETSADPLGEDGTLACEKLVVASLGNSLNTRASPEYDSVLFNSIHFNTLSLSTLSPTLNWENKSSAAPHDSKNGQKYK